MTDRFEFRAWDTVACIYEYEIQYSLFDYYIDDDRYVIEQCTGLKDDDGHPIYEGDIVFCVALADGFTGDTGIGRVEWDDVLLRYVVMIDDECRTFDDLGDSVVVIGNIHENPELLEE